MSRGDGRLQRAILEHMHAATGPVTFEALRWNLWETLENATDDPQGALPTRWNTSLGRAVQSLAGRSRGSIVLEKRRLSSMDEFVEHYPGKTLKRAVRSLRLALLPEIGRWAQDNGPRYSPGMNERFHLESLTPKAHRRLQRTWHGLVPMLVSLLPGVAPDKQNILFLLIAKGKSVFDTREIECRRSFAEFLQPCLEAEILPPDLRSQLTEFSQTLLPPEEAGFLRVKSYVHSLAHVPRHGRCTLQAETMEYLDGACPNIIRALPGYEAPPEPSRSRPRRAIYNAGPKHSKQLHLLIDHTVFQNFQFLMTG